MSTYRLPRGYAYSHTGGNRTAPPNHAISWSFSPSNFNGKERDGETGHGYTSALGGRYQNYYYYDPLHRLTHANGANQYRFEQAFELSPAGRPLSMSTNGKVKHYAYGEHTPPHAPQRIMVEEGFRHTLHDLRWDPAGNLGQVSTLAHDRGDIQSRFLFWTEDSRLHTVVDDRHHSYYAYDHTGGSCGSRAQSQACLSYAEMQQRRRSQRTLKVTGYSHQLDVNADLMHTAAGLDEFTLYPSPYLVFTNRGYTKHYYAGTERLAARIGGGFDRAILREQTDLAMTATHLFKQSRHHTNERHLNAPPAHTIRREGHLERVFRGMEIEFAIPEAVRAEVHLDPEGLIQAAQNIVSDNTEPEVYFYHSDHLGSASWITDGAGIPIQHLQYLPYGEPFVNQRAAGSTYSERFRFTGKERDEETGFGYFGARYMDHELMTMWLSVDPMSDKYPSISPYAYCAWNPVKLVDPDGNEIDEWDFNKTTGELVWVSDRGCNTGTNYVNIVDSYGGYYGSYVGSGNHGFSTSSGTDENGNSLVNFEQFNMCFTLFHPEMGDCSINETPQGTPNASRADPLGTAKHIAVLADAFSAPQEGLIRYASGSSSNVSKTAGKAVGNYFKAMKGIGWAGTVTAVAASGMQLRDYYGNGGTSLGVGLKLTLDMGMSVLSNFGPIGMAGGFAYSLLDICTGGFGTNNELNKYRR